MKCKKIILVLIMFIFAGSFFSAGNDVISKADDYYLHDDYSSAYDVLKQEYNSGNKNFEILWRLARARKNMVTDEMEENQKDKAISIYEEAQKFAEEANSVKPQNDMGHYWLAAIYGSIGLVKGVLNALFLMDPMEEESGKALSFNPNCSDAYYILANLYYKGRAAVPLASKDGNYLIAFSYMYKAIELAEAKKYDTDIISLYYKDFIFFLTNRNYDLSKAIDKWEDAKKKYGKAGTGKEKEKYYYGILNKPTKSDRELAQYYYSILKNLPVVHKWDQESKDEAYDMLK